MAEKSAVGIAFERRGTGPPLLMLHGTGGTRGHWRPVVGLLAQNRELLLVDLPGHGSSDPPAESTPHTPVGYASTLAGLLDELGIDSAHVAGNSVGGWTALELAKLGRAQSVVALAPAGLWRRHDPWRCSFQLWSQYRLGRMFAALTPTIMRSGIGRTLALRGTMAKPRQMPAEEAIEMASTFAQTPTFPAHLAATRKDRFRNGHDIDVPVTVVWGNKERLIPAKARLRDELPAHTHYLTLQGCGHSPMWDDPELVARTILDGTDTPATQTTPA